jgi:uncharacterized protein (TIGR02246 family)
MSVTSPTEFRGRAPWAGLVLIGVLMEPQPGFAMDTGEAAVLAAERGLAEAQMRNDFAAVNQLLTPDYTFTIPNGVIVSKARFLQDMSKFWKPTLVENDKQTVRLYGGTTAIVSGEARYRWVNDKKVEEEARERYTDTYVLKDGRWQRAASHSSCLAGRCS